MRKYTVTDYCELGKGAATLDELTAQYPEEWETVRADLAGVAETKRKTLLRDYLRLFEVHRQRIVKSGANSKVIEVSFAFLVRARMLTLALEKMQVALESGALEGNATGKPIRLGLITGTIIQKLFFERDLVRKPASLPLVRLLWPLLPGRRVLMPLVQKKGIWCFYSKPLIDGLAAMIAGRACLEIGAGDGTLTRFLRAKNVTIRATDDYSWSRYIQFPAEVEQMGAVAALARYRPEAVVCSWPPPGNTFEEKVFATPSVQLYIVIGSRNGAASGNQSVYRTQTTFAWERDERLSKLVLPPGGQHAVDVFRRI
jgi:hypothetical protein